MRRPLGLFALALALAGTPSGAQDAREPSKLLREYFAAREVETRRALAGRLDAFPVPRDAVARERSLRDALALAPRPGGSRATERIASARDFPTECFYATPRGYDARKRWPAVLSLHGRGGDGHQALIPFALPKEEWADLVAETERRLRESGKVPPGASVEVKRNPLVVPFEDGLVVAPTYTDKEESGFPVERGIAVALGSIERLHRAFASDPDRVVGAGISLGAGIIEHLAIRHPDRFAGIAILAGADPRLRYENLRTPAVPVYVLYGDADPSFPVAVGRALDARLKEAGVPHVTREVEGLEHRWPSPAEGRRLRAWMRERARTPWPRAVVHRFEASTEPRRVWWLELPPGGEATVDAKVEGNEVALVVTGAPSVVLHLGEPLVDLEQDVVVRLGEAEVHRGRVARSWSETLADLERDGFDLPRAAPARLEVKAPTSEGRR